MTELGDAISELEKARPKKKKSFPTFLVAAIVLVIVLIAGGIIWYAGFLFVGEEVSSFPITGSYICFVEGKEYLVYEENYFFVEGEKLALVSDGQKYLYTTTSEYSQENTNPNYFVSAPGAKCRVDSIPEQIMEEASETGIVVLEGKGFIVEPGKVVA